LLGFVTVWPVYFAVANKYDCRLQGVRGDTTIEYTRIAREVVDEAAAKLRMCYAARAPLRQAHHRS